MLMLLLLNNDNVVLSFSSSSVMIPKLNIKSFRPQGTAKTPLEKKTVAVTGSAGYLGSVTLGYLQRAGSLYETGLSSSPKLLSATAVGLVNANKCLTKNFLLGFLGEDSTRLVNFQDANYISKRLVGIDSIILGTKYYRQERPITGGTYAKTPNEKTFELFLDRPRQPGGGMIVDRSDQDNNDDELDFTIFDNTLQACEIASKTVKHLVVLETPQTKQKEQFTQRLEKSSIPYTYVRLGGELQTKRDHSYIMGLQGDLTIQSCSLNEEIPTSAPIYREDVAAVLVQCLQSLDWDESRCLSIQSEGDWSQAIQSTNQEGKFSNVWCSNSLELASKLSKL